MRTLLRAAALVAALVGFGTAAQQRAELQADRQEQEVVAGTVKGELLLVEPLPELRSEFKIRDAVGAEQAFKTDGATQVVYGDKAAKLQDFKEGAQVRTSYVVDSQNEKVAREVRILQAAPKPSAK